jgi:hypothetical protein
MSRRLRTVNMKYFRVTCYAIFCWPALLLLGLLAREPLVLLVVVEPKVWYVRFKLAPFSNPFVHVCRSENIFDIQTTEAAAAGSNIPPVD